MAPAMSSCEAPGVAATRSRTPTCLGFRSSFAIRSATVGAVVEAAADVACIVLTHAHPDHVQAAPELRERTGARVLVHTADAAWLSHGHVPGTGRSGVSARAYDRLPRARWAPFQPDGTVEDGDPLPEPALDTFHAFLAKHRR